MRTFPSSACLSSQPRLGIRETRGSTTLPRCSSHPGRCRGLLSAPYLLRARRLQRKSADRRTSPCRSAISCRSWPRRHLQKGQLTRVETKRQSKDRASKQRTALSLIGDISSSIKPVSTHGENFLLPVLAGKSSRCLATQHCNLVSPISPPTLILILPPPSPGPGSTHA